ncbi:MAG TPA: hypothetical protein VGB95_06795, partial [Chitinophagales bacterium]
MPYKIVLTPDAVQNIEDAIIHYKEQASSKVARQFIEEYKKTFRDIQRVKYFQFWYQEFRGVPMKKFPFIVFYT